MASAHEAIDAGLRQVAGRRRRDPLVLDDAQARRPSPGLLDELRLALADLRGELRPRPQDALGDEPLAPALEGHLEDSIAELEQLA